MATKKESLISSSAFGFPPARVTKNDVKKIEKWISKLEEEKKWNQSLIEGNQERIANFQKELQDPSTSVERREGLRRDVQLYESNIQAWQQVIKGCEADLRVQRSALQAIATTRESEEFLRNIEKHIQNSGSVDRFLAHLVFVGLPGSGKSTLIARLLKRLGIEKMLKANDSTGVMNGVITVDVGKDKASMYPANTINCEWKEADFKVSCFRQMGAKCLVVTKKDQSHSDPPKSVGIGSGQKRSKKSQRKSGRKQKQVHVSAHARNMEHVATPVQNMMPEANHVLGSFKGEDFSDIRPFLDNKFSLYLSDTGGQIEFQELLPLLVAGVAIFIFIFPLNIDFDKPVAVSYRKKVGGTLKHTNSYTSSLTIKESFLQTLASIDSMEASADPTIAKHNPYVFVVGTHKDCLIKELGEDGAATRIKGIDGSIQRLIKEHKFENLVVYADNSVDQVLFAVDNTREDLVFQKIRGRIIELTEKGDEFRIQFPLSYLLASLDLQELDQPFVKRKDFAVSVLRYGITEEDVDHLLYFLHSRIGQIRYFSRSDLKELIVREPQSLYNLVTSIIIRSFHTMAKRSEVRRGIYSMDSLHVEEFASLSEFVTPEQVVGLLKELRIIAPFYDHNAEVEKYFIPCVLNHLSESPEEDKPSSVQSLIITFKCGHCPKGMFGVLLHYILTHEDKKLEWNLDINKIFRDQVSLEVGPYGDAISIKFSTTYLEVRCHPSDMNQREESFSIKNICNMVRSTLTSGIEQATDCLHYSRKKTAHSLALVCDVCNKVCSVTIVGTRHVLTGNCLQSRHDRIPDPACFWFGSIQNYSFPDLMESDVLCLEEGTFHVIPFSVVCEPPLATTERHVLSKEIGDIRRQYVYIRCDSVRLDRIKRRDAGIYFISSPNPFVEGKASFELRVKFPPEYTMKQSYLEAVEGTSPSVSFSIISEPPLGDDVKHTLTTNAGGRVPGRFTIEKKNCIFFRNVSVSDSGVYTIRCHNDDDKVGKADVELVVTPKPDSEEVSSQASFSQIDPSKGTPDLNWYHDDYDDNYQSRESESLRYPPNHPFGDSHYANQPHNPQNIGVNSRGVYQHLSPYTSSHPHMSHLGYASYPVDSLSAGVQDLHLPPPPSHGYPPHQHSNFAGVGYAMPTQYPPIHGPSPMWRAPVNAPGYWEQQVGPSYGVPYQSSVSGVGPYGSQNAPPWAQGHSQVPAHYGHQNVQGGSQHSMPPDGHSSSVLSSPHLPRDTAAQPMAHHQVSSLAHGMSPQDNFSSPQTPTQHSVLTQRTLVESRHYGILCRQLRPCAAKWREIAQGLRFHPGEIANIQADQTHLAGGPGAYMDAVLKVWMEKGPGDDRGSTDVATLEELVLAVRRANCGRIAQTLTLTDS